MPVLRTKKTSNYTVMSNYHFWDEHLSLKAKGMLSFFLALPDDWEFSILGLAKILKEGKYSVQMALQELEVLKTEFPKTWEHWITELSEYMEYTGKSYANHLLTIQKWSRAKPLRPAESGAARRYGCPSFNQSPYEPETYYQCDGEDSL